MSRIKMRLVRAEPVEKSGAFMVVLHIFEVLAHMEKEGDAYAACVEGFNGSIESVGSTEEEVIQGLFDGLMLTIDHHIEHETLGQFMEAHGMRQVRLDRPWLRDIECDHEVDREVTYMQPTPRVTEGTLACAG